MKRKRDRSVSGQPTASLRTTHHGVLRLQQRGISLRAVEATLTWGWEYRVDKGMVALYLSRRAVREATRKGANVRAFINTVLLLSGARLVTAYRTPKLTHTWSRVR